MVQIPRYIIDRDAPGPGRPVRPGHVEPRRVDPVPVRPGHVEPARIQVGEPRMAPGTIRASGAVGEAIADAGGAINRIASQFLGEQQQLKKMEEQAKEMGIVAQQETQLRARIQERLAAAQQASPLTAGDEAPKILLEELGELKKWLGEQKLSSASGKYLVAKYNQITASEIPRMRKAQVQAIHNDTLSKTFANIEGQKKIAIETNDPMVRAGAEATVDGMYLALVQGGMMTPEDAFDNTQKAIGEIEQMRVLGEINRDPDAFLLKDLEKEHPSLTAKQILDFRDTATKEGNRRDRELEEQSEKAEKTLVDALEVLAVDGALNDELLDSLVYTNKLSPESRTKLITFRDDMQERRTTVVSDPVTVNQFRIEMFDENPAVYRQRVLNAMRGPNPLLSTEDGKQLLNDNAALADLSKVPGFNDAVKEIRGVLGGRGLLTAFDINREKRVSNALFELKKRVKAGEDPNLIYPEIIQRWERGTVPQVIGEPRFESPGDLQKAFDKKSITREVFMKEVEILKERERQSFATKTTRK